MLAAPCLVEPDVRAWPLVGRCLFDNRAARYAASSRVVYGLGIASSARGNTSRDDRSLRGGEDLPITGLE